MRRSPPRHRQGRRRSPVTGNRADLGGRDPDLGARWKPQLTTLLQPVEEPYTDREHDECDEHGKAEGADEMTEQRAEGVAEEIADRNKARRPQTRSNEIQYHEPFPINCAHPHRKRTEIS